ncbi:hypothetical protein Aeqsu_3091 [Aequorivita sublithincola DSM 14238]|uniref:Uncharacterized protein n=1 Tax=Aequorivita sublithincola (strain DSM 14238 / LMG 21431 / ACAM 643 / 9-3) TaxID=746697 RepID=I3YZW0_AEQSU|nr:hypothetical protein Aeqsu_3091 [Aequorivita sublithincola DSM 14238]
MFNILKENIQDYFIGQSTIEKDKLVANILLNFPELKESSINVYLSLLKKEGVIQNPSRGIYALEEMNSYIPTIDIKQKRLFRKIKKDLPFIDFCIWNTKWLNEFMLHQPFKYYTVLEIEKDAIEPVFYLLKEQGKPVFLEPDADTFDLYINNSEDVIILKQLITESPLQEIENILIPTLEKLLVDMTIDTNLYSAQQGEIKLIFTSAFEKYTVNKNRMKRYSYRRNRENEIEKLTNLTLANIA